MDAEKRNIAVLTEEDVLTLATAYAPCAAKTAFVDSVAARCFDRLELTTEEGDTVPPMWKENAGRKAKYMTAALAGIYLRILPERENAPWELTDEEYDALAESQLVSQLERIKKATRNPAVRDKIYDLLADYRFLERLLNAECYGLLNAMNDTVSRLKSLLTASVTPEAIQALQEEAEKTKSEVEAYLKARGNET